MNNYFVHHNFRTSFSQDAQFPIVDSFGGTHEISGAVEPGTKILYKIVIDLKSLLVNKEQLNQGGEQRSENDESSWVWWSFERKN